MFLRPHFDPEEIERERTQHIAGLRSLHSEPDWPAETTARRRILAGTSYAEPIEGTERVIREIGREAIVGLHRRLLTTPGFIVASGDISVDALYRLLDQRLGREDLPGHLPQSAPPAPVQSPTPGLILVDRHGSAHTSLRIARPAVPRRHPDYIPLRLLTTILGDTFNSRLNNRLREELGVTYGAWASLEGKRDAGALWIGTSVESGQVAATIETIREEIDRLGSEEVSPEELDLVTRYMAGRHALSRETPEQVGSLISTLLLYDLPRDHYSRTIESIRGVTPEQLLETARRYFRAADFTIVAAGEGERLLPELEKSGTVEQLGD